MLNKVLLIGNSTRDIELRYLPSGQAVAKTGIAVNRKWKDKNSGESKQEVMFIDVVIYGRSAEVANQYLTKGKKVLVEGRLVLEQWTDQSGQKRSKHTVSVENFEFLDSKGETGADGSYPAESNDSFDKQPSSYQQPSQQPKRAPSQDIYNEEIPF